MGVRLLQWQRVVLRWRVVLRLRIRMCLSLLAAMRRQVAIFPIATTR